MVRYLTVVPRLRVLALLTVGLLATASYAQVADGNLVGTIFDSTGAVIPNATVESENLATSARTAVKSDASGAYRISNLLVGSYKLTATAQGMTTTSLMRVDVELNKTTTANMTLKVGPVTTTVEVIDSTELIDTTTAQISNTYATRLISELPSAANSLGGYLNISLLGAGVTSSGGIGAGTGPSVGGQRPRNNNYMIEGVDNNRKDVTGPIVGLPVDSVAEFTVLQNQFSPEFGHSSGGQFSAVIKSGGNEVHGIAYDYLQNRYLNAQDQFFKRQEIFDRQRYDSNTFGGAIGGPIKKNKLFYYGNFDYNPAAAASTSALFAPTAAGYDTIAGISGISQTNLSIFKKYVGTAPEQYNGFAVSVSKNAIPIGIVPVSVNAYSNVYRWLGSVDYNMSEKDQWRFRYIAKNESRVDTSAAIPDFYTVRPTYGHVFSLAQLHTFRPNLINEARLAYSRYHDDIKSPNVQFPGLDMFPNIIVRDLGDQIGPNQNAPQSVVQNTYQFVDNVSWIKGNHNMKFGFDGRDITMPWNFVQRIRGDYQYNTFQRYLLDLYPDGLAQRTLGANGAAAYSGNSHALYGFANDEWRLKRNFSLSLGLRYEFNSVSRSMKEFAQNSIADVPGVITFFAPESQKKNFAPRIGFAYSPGHSGKTSIRGGFGIAYDQIFDNIGANVRPPQATTTLSVATTQAIPNFLSTGGLPPTFPDLGSSAEYARAYTAGWLPNQKLASALNWNFGVQRVFGKDYTLDVRYLGTRGEHLLLQTILNRNAIVTATHSLPTYLTSPTPAELNSLPLTLTQLQNEMKSPLGNPLQPYGFPQQITSYGPQGNSIYHGLAAEVTKRFSDHLTFKGAYTWSHLMDDSTMEINFTTLSPRRPQNFQDLRSEWASSALDRRHRLTLTWLYATPWFEHSPNRVLKHVFGNYQVSGTYTAESPEYVTPQSATDSNLNTDSAGDRVILNPNGVPGTSSDVTALRNSANVIVAYLAQDPNAQYIKAAAGAYANSGRNTLAAEGINNFDFSVSKVIPLRERYRFELRADFFNGLNHPQYTPGRINNVLSTSHVSETNYLTPGNPLFGQWDQVYGSNPRVIQAVAKFTF